MAHRISGYMGDRKSPSCVYVGNLPDDIKERELEDLFLKFGRIEYIDIKRGRTTNGTAYAFVEFESVKDAQDAVERRHGYPFGHTYLRVELTGERKQKRREPFVPPPQRRTFRTEHRVIVTHLPDGCRWQHLKDHMRRAGDVGYANVEGGRGIVEYLRGEDLRYALDKLDATEMVGPYGDASVIKVREDEYHDGGYGRDGYSRKKYNRSRSGDRDYKRRSRSFSNSDRISQPRIRRSSLHHVSSRTGKNFDDLRKKGDDDYGRGKSYSRSRSRSRSVGHESQSRSRSRDRRHARDGSYGRGRDNENLRERRRNRSQSNDSYKSNKSNYVEDRKGRGTSGRDYEMNYYSSKQECQSRKKSRGEEEIVKHCKNESITNEGRTANNEYDDMNNNSNGYYNNKQNDYRRKNSRSRSNSETKSTARLNNNNIHDEKDEKGDYSNRDDNKEIDLLKNRHIYEEQDEAMDAK